MKQGSIRVKRDDVDVLGTVTDWFWSRSEIDRKISIYKKETANIGLQHVEMFIRMYSGTAKDGTGCERAEVVNIDYFTLLD